MEEKERYEFEFRARYQLNEYQRWVDKEITKLTKENQQLKQSQKQLAIEELKGLRDKVKELKGEE